MCLSPSAAVVCMTWGISKSMCRALLYKRLMTKSLIPKLDSRGTILFMFFSLKILLLIGGEYNSLHNFRSKSRRRNKKKYKLLIKIFGEWGFINLLDSLLQGLPDLLLHDSFKTWLSFASVGTQERTILMTDGRFISFWFMILQFLILTEWFL